MTVCFLQGGLTAAQVAMNAGHTAIQKLLMHGPGGEAGECARALGLKLGADSLCFGGKPNNGRDERGDAVVE